MRSITLFCTCVVVAVGGVAELALASDAEEALEELKEGYALKQANDCAQALPHLARSVLLDRRPKALLNLSDCERKVGDLVSAEAHATEGHRLARQAGEGELVGVADQQLAEIEKELPRLTLTLSPDAPRDSSVYRDGVALESASLGTSFGVNPGKHSIAVSAPGRAERRFEVTLGEGDQRQIEVSPGAPLSANTEEAGARMPLGERRPSRAATSSPPTQTQGAIALGAVGVVGVALGSAYGLAAVAQNDKSYENGHCVDNHCDGTGANLRNLALRDATASTILFAAGLASLAAGVVLWVTAPPARSTPASASLGVSAAAFRDGGGAVLRGRW